MVHITGMIYASIDVEVIRWPPRVRHVMVARAEWDADTILGLPEWLDLLLDHYPSRPYPLPDPGSSGLC